MGTTPDRDPNASLMSSSSMAGANVDIGKDEYPAIETVEDGKPFVPVRKHGLMTASQMLKNRLRNMPYRDRSGER